MPKRETPHPGQLVIETAPQPKPRSRAVVATTKVEWMAYRAVDPYPCDWCKLNQVEDRTAPIARKARYRRRAPGQPEQYLCLAHANDQRVADRLPKFLR